MAENEVNLGNLSPDEAALVARYPLPDDAVDGLLNKAQLETATGISQTTISAYLRQGLPYVEAGTNGRSYVFRLSVVHAWLEARRENDKAARAAGDEVAAQYQLAFLGGDTAARVDGRMSLTDQRKLLELELQRMSAARQRGELMRRDDVVAGFERVFAAIRDALDAMPDRLAREFGLEGRDLERVEMICDDGLAQAAREVEAIVKHDDGASGG